MSAQISEWLERAVALPGAVERVVIVEDTWQANLRWALNSLTTNGHSHQRRATVISFARQGATAQAGVVGGAIGELDDLLDLARRADVAAAAAPPSEDADSLPEPRVDEDFSQAATPTDMGVFRSFARDLGAAFEQARGAGQLLFGFAEHSVQTTWLATTSGARRRTVVPHGRVELNAKVGKTASAWVGAATRDFTDVDVSGLYGEAVRRLQWSSRRIDLPAGRYETLLPPSAVADLLIYAYWTMNARDAEEGRNVYAGKKVGETRIGERIATLPLTLASDPTRLPGSPFAVVPVAEPGMTSVFDNGADVGRVEWIRRGVLTELVRTRAGRRGSGGDAARPLFPTQNLIAEAESATTLDEMIANTKRGLLLTCLWYIREVDPQTLLLTGLTRDGVYLVEDGEVVGAVNNFRFNESPVDLLRRATEFSVAEPTLCREWNDYFTWTVVPAMRVPDFMMSTVSPAT